MGIGDGVAHCCPIYEGFIMKQGMKRMNVAGGEVTDYLAQLLAERGYTFETSAEREIVREIKEQLSYVALDFDSEIKRAETTDDVQKHYELPDGQIITVGPERFRCAELLFRPNLIEHHSQGIHRMIYESMKAC